MANKNIKYFKCNAHYYNLPNIIKIKMKQSYLLLFKHFLEIKFSWCHLLITAPRRAQALRRRASNTTVSFQSSTNLVSTCWLIITNGTTNSSHCFSNYNTSIIIATSNRWRNSDNCTKGNFFTANAVFIIEFALFT